jgi:hypothetical protein
MKLSHVPLAVALTLFLSAPVQAGIPLGGDSIEIRKNDQLLQVCADDPTIECRERDLGAFAHPFTGSECEAAGLDAMCEIAFVKHSSVRGTLVLTADEDLDSGEIAVTLVYTFRLGAGRPVHVLTETYPDGSAIGNWNPLLSESEVFDATGVGQIIDGTLEPFATELTRLLDAWLEKRHRELPASVPVVVHIERVAPRFDSEHADDEDPLGSSATYRVDFRFARIQEGP